jgi:hypothetical protein
MGEILGWDAVLRNNGTAGAHDRAEQHHLRVAVGRIPHDCEPPEPAALRALHVVLVVLVRIEQVNVT